MNMPSRWNSVLLTALGPIIWGSTYIITSELLPPGLPFTAALIRCLPAGILLVLASRFLPPPRMWPRLLLLSILNISFFQSMLFVAAYRLPSGLAAVLGALQPLVVMMLAWLVDQRRPPSLALGASVLAVAGMALLLLSPGSRWDLTGVLAALAGTLSMACGTFLSQRWRASAPVLPFTGWQLLLGGLVLAPVSWLVDPPLPALTQVQVLAYGYLCLFGAVLAYTLWFRGVMTLKPEAAASLGLLSPLTAVVLGWVILGQAAGGLALLGLITVLACVLAVQWSLR